MRILLVIPLLLVGACNVSKDETNNTVSVTFNQEVATNVGADVSNGVENIASDIGNDVRKTGDKIQNTDVDLKVNSNAGTDNKADKKK
jgi:hypothetical protein